MPLGSSATSFAPSDSEPPRKLANVSADPLAFSFATYASVTPPLKNGSNASAVVVPSATAAPASHALPLASGATADAPDVPRKVE